jgi:hypothetical protein
MKIEIDLNDILYDENYGSETLQESVKRQVIDNLTKTVSLGIKKQIDTEVSLVISETLKSTLAEKIPLLVDDLMEAKYQPINKWGSKEGEETTFRKSLLNSIVENMVYKKTSYDSDRNVFTKAVDDVIREQMEKIKIEYKKTVDESIGKEAF